MTDEQEQPPITVYTTSTCRICERVITMIEKAGIAVEVVDLDDPRFSDARSYVTNVLGAKSVPVVVADDHEPVFGYDPTKLGLLIAQVRLDIERNNDGP